MNLQELWSQLTPARLTAAALTAEGAALGDETGLLLTLDARGEAVSERPLPSPVHDVAAYPEGDLVAAACGQGEVVLLSAGGVVFRKSPDIGATMVRIGPHGDYLLALAPSGKGVFLNRYGREMGTLRAPGGARSVALVPGTGEIVVVGRRGVVQGFTSWGKPLWQMELAGTTGRAATDDRGSLVLIPVMAYGVEALTAKGRRVGAYDVGEPVKAAACSGDGEALLFATSDDRLVLLRKDATVTSAEMFPAPVEDVAVSGDGRRALVTTGSGYAHLLAVTERAGRPLLEMGRSAGGSRPHYLVRRRVFSPFSILIQARLDFAPGGEAIAVAGDRRRVQVLDLKGEALASRRWGGSLLDVGFLTDGSVRVLASQSVFRFRPDREGSYPEWTAQAELTRVALCGRDRAVGVTEDGEVLSFGPERCRAESRFFLDDPRVSDLALLGSRLAVATKAGEIRILDERGYTVGGSGPWPSPARLLAVGECGLLVGVRKLLMLLDPGGREVWRHHLPAPVRRAVPVGGSFLVLDQAGSAHTVTTKGVVRRAFAAGKGEVVPFADAGEGPGFLVAEGDLLTAIHPTGAPRWRFRTPEAISYLRASPDGRYAAALAGLELFVFPVLRDTPAEPRRRAAVEYLEFADG